MRSSSALSTARPRRLQCDRTSSHLSRGISHVPTRRLPKRHRANRPNRHRSRRRLFCARQRLSRNRTSAEKSLAKVGACRRQAIGCQNWPSDHCLSCFQSSPKTPIAVCARIRSRLTSLLSRLRPVSMQTALPPTRCLSSRMTQAGHSWHQVATRFTALRRRSGDSGQVPGLYNSERGLSSNRTALSRHLWSILIRF
jgi:hypothetical protein